MVGLESGDVFIPLVEGRVRIGGRVSCVRSRLDEASDDWDR